MTSAIRDLDGADPDVRPQDDLFRAVNGTWLREHVIPEDRPADGSFLALRDLSEERVRDIITELGARSAQPGAAAPERGSVEQKVGDAYAAFMDEDAIEAAGVGPLEEDLAQLRAAQDHDALALALTRVALSGVRGVVAMGTAPSRNDPERYSLYVIQSGIGLPDESYYRDEDKAEIREKYVAHVARMLRLGGLASDDDAAADGARRIMDLETRIAKGHWTKVESRDAVKSNNVMSFAELAAQAPGYPWEAVRDELAAFADVDAAHLDDPCVMQPSAQTNAARVWAEAELADLVLLASWMLLDSRAGLLTKEIVEADFDFHGRILTGTEQLKDRWKRGVSLVEGALGEEVGRLYVDRHFPPAHKAHIEGLVADLVEAYRDSISVLDWMGEETRARALDKLAAFDPKVGYPVTWRDHAELDIPAGDLVGAVRASSRFEERRDLRRLTEPVDRDEWLMTPQTVNAYYSPLKNEIVFPAAILQPPFFDPDGDDAANYGGIGAVIGHEIGHGFDDQGSRYDGTGKLEDWWTDEDRAEFDERAGVLIAQYDGLRPEQLDEGETVNGSLTIGENIGDLGGLTIALKAYEIALRRQGLGGLADAPEEGGLTGAQRLFVNWARVWRQKSRDELARQRIATDPHSPNEFRCNQVARNIDAFHEAFGVTEDDEMWLDPKDRVRIW